MNKLKICLASVKTVPCDVYGNAGRIKEKYGQFCLANADIAAFPELCVTGFSCGAYFGQDILLEAAEKAVAELIPLTAGRHTALIIGCPVRHGGKLYNCAAVIRDGILSALVPEVCPSGENKSAFSGFAAPFETSYAGFSVTADTGALFDIAGVSVAIICGSSLLDGTASPVPAELTVNITADAELVGRADYRRDIVKLFGGAVAFCSSGDGESTSSCVYSGHLLVASGNAVTAEALPFSGADCVAGITPEIPDGGFAGRFAAYVAAKNALKVRPYPFIPEANENARWRTVLDIQSRALAKRLEVCHAVPVLNVSGGLDSTLAFIVCLEAMKLLGRPASDIVCITLPCFGTTSRTKTNAEIICRGMGADFRTVNIASAVAGHLADIGHSGSALDAAYENSQARERTQVGMDIANMVGGILIGTGDLSELALGWATYNGDHMSMYSVNANIPKSVISHILRYYASTLENAEVAGALCDVCETPVSPELLPADGNAIVQKTEDINGPYAIHDFIIYYTVRYGFTPSKIYALAKEAFDGIYGDAVLKHTFTVFCRRFAIMQFKRSCGADSPAIGSVSVVGEAWRAPSDASAALWKLEADVINAEK